MQSFHHQRHDSYAEKLSGGLACQLHLLHNLADDLSEEKDALQRLMYMVPFVKHCLQQPAAFPGTY
jgi:hypothetical protein